MLYNPAMSKYAMLLFDDYASNRFCYIFRGLRVPSPPDFKNTVSRKHLFEVLHTELRLLFTILSIQYLL